ncbi:MAG: hypothetical protein WD556_10585 [Actinomycetota bacterium]
MSRPAGRDGLWDEPSRYGAVFWIGAAVGWAAIGFGLLSLFQRSGATDPTSSGSLFAVLLLGHDLVVVPLVAFAGVVLLRRVPVGARGPVTGAMIATGVLALVSFPLLGGFGGIASNPSLLPRNYVAGTAIALVTIWAVTAAVLLRARATGQRGG